MVDSDSNKAADEWQYHPAADLDASMSEALRSFPRAPNMSANILRTLAALLLRLWLRLYHRFQITGGEHLPTSGSHVLVCNHTSHLDTLCLLSAIPIGKIHRTFPAAAADYFFSSLPRSAVSAILINALPFDRKAKGAESLEVCSQLLANNGNILIIFPEGTRAASGEMGRFRSGVGRIVAGTNYEVVPCYLSGGMQAWPKGKVIPRPRKLHLRIGVAQSFTHLDKTTESVKEICRTLQDSVKTLGRQTP